MLNYIKVSKLQILQFHISRGGAAAARVAHNHEVAGSSPAPATKKLFTSVILAEVFVLSQNSESDSSLCYSARMDYLEKTIHAYDVAPDKYASATGVMVNELEIGIMLQNMPGGEKAILDVGCGPGRNAQILSRRGYKVTGIDMSKELLERAKRTNPELDFRLMDVRNLGFSDDTFGAA